MLELKVLTKRPLLMPKGTLPFAAALFRMVQIPIGVTSSQMIAAKARDRGAFNRGETVLNGKFDQVGDRF